MPFLENAAPLIGRVLLSLIFLVSGVGKLAAPAATKGYIAMSGLPLPDAAYVLAVAIEIGGGLALLLGVRARGAAATLALFALVTAFAFHAQFGDQNQMIHWLKNLAIAGGLLQIVGFGAGAYSIDARLAGRPAKPLPAAV